MVTMIFGLVFLAASPVVIQHTVQGLDPLRVHVTVTHHPAVLLNRLLGNLVSERTRATNSQQFEAG